MRKLKRVICALFGHSRIVTSCFGYISCARCGDQIGDVLAGGFRFEGAVLLGCPCEQCRGHARKLTWRDRLLAPGPLTPGAGGSKQGKESE